MNTTERLIHEVKASEIDVWTLQGIKRGADSLTESGGENEFRSAAHKSLARARGRNVKAWEDLTRHIQQLEQERDGLNRDQTELAARVDELKAQLANHATAPRVISAEEMKAGQKIAFETVDGDGDVFTVQSVDTSWEGYLAVYNTRWGFWAITEDERIWLLQDAPAEEPEPVKVGDTISTAEQLDSLPGGSVVLDHVGDAHQKGGDGEWWETARPEGRDSVDVARYAPFTVLYLPEEDA